MIKDQLIYLIEEYANTKVNLSWSGGHPPEEIVQLEDEFEEAKFNLEKFINENIID